MRLLPALCLLPAAGALLFAQPRPLSEDLCIAPPGARPSLPARLLPGQGRAHLTITTRSPQAQEFFNQGLAQLHSFFSREAERSFLQAAQLDPDAPMPHWGVAMAAAGDYRPAFQLADDRGQRRPAGVRPRSWDKAAFGPSGPERAREAAARASELARNGDAREKLYIAAVAARRNPASKDPEGDYIRAWRHLLREFPREWEAASFLALALMSGYTPVDKKPRQGTSEAAAWLEEILKHDPDHVGAHHYVIHALEGSSRAQDAWHSSKRYPELAPQIPHALHMPGHIYVQTGRWADAAQAFEQAARKERELMSADQLYGSGHHGHNLHFLASTYCFLDKYSAALEVSAELLAIRETPREASQLTNTRTAHRQGWFARLRTLVHFRQWDQILDGVQLPEYPGPRERAWRHWARGLALAARGETASAAAESKRLDEQMTAWEKAYGSPSPQLAVAKMELEAQLELRSGRAAKGLDLLERAANLELRLRYNEPPSYPRPVWEALGQSAMEWRDFARAESAFRRALQQNPASAAAQKGLAAALQQRSLPAAP